MAYVNAETVKNEINNKIKNLSAILDDSDGPIALTLQHHLGDILSQLRILAAVESGEKGEDDDLESQAIVTPAEGGVLGDTAEMN